MRNGWVLQYGEGKRYDIVVEAILNTPPNDIQQAIEKIEAFVEDVVAHTDYKEEKRESFK